MKDHAQESKCPFLTVKQSLQTCLGLQVSKRARPAKTLDTPLPIILSMLCPGRTHQDSNLALDLELQQETNTSAKSDTRESRVEYCNPKAPDTSPGF